MIRSVAFITNGALSLTNFRGTLIAGLVRDGVRVFGLAPDFDDAQRARLRALGAEPVDIDMARAGTNPLREAWSTIGLWRTLRRLSPDAVFCYFFKPVIYGTLAASFARVPRRIAMIEGLGYVFAGEGGIKRRALRAVTERLVRMATKRADRVVFCNPVDVADFVSAQLVDPAKAIDIGGIGVDLGDFPLVVPVTQPITFLLMARLLREKGVSEFAAAAAQVKRRHPTARFVLLGGLDPNPGGISRDEVEDWVRQGAIEWHGHVDDVRGSIAASSVFVLPSYYREGVPRSIQEAMAMGRAIITTDNVGCRDTVDDGVNGYLVPMRSIDALAEAMQRFIDEPALVERMGRESRRLAEERFDVRVKDAILRTLILGVD